MFSSAHSATDGVEPRVIVMTTWQVTRRLFAVVLPNSEHPCHKCLDNRSEHSHRPVRKRKRAIQRFKSPEQARRFLETFSPICNHFRPRHSLSAQRYPEIMRVSQRSATPRSCATVSARGGRSHVQHCQPEPAPYRRTALRQAAVRTGRAKQLVSVSSWTRHSRSA